MILRIIKNRNIFQTHWKTLAFTFTNYIRTLIAQKLDDNRSYMRESFVKGLLRKSVPQSKVAARLRLNVLCWCTSEACKCSIISAMVMAAAMTSFSTAIFERFTSAFVRKVYEQVMALIQSRSLKPRYQNF